MPGNPDNLSPPALNPEDPVLPEEYGPDDPPEPATTIARGEYEVDEYADGDESFDDEYLDSVGFDDDLEDYTEAEGDFDLGEE